MTAKVIQGSFLAGQPRLSVAQRGVVAEPPTYAKTVVHPLGQPAFASSPPGPPAPAFAARPPGRPAPAFAGRGAAVQRQGAGGAFAVEAGALGLAAGGGRALPEALRGKMEAALGADFSAVRVHVGPQAERIGAIAFTLGSDIYFAPGRYQPDTVPGQQLLGHELAHVVQQRAGRVKNPLGSGIAVVQDHALEAEADRLGQRAAMHRVAVQAKTASAAMGGVRVSPPVAAGPGRYRLVAGSGGRPAGSVMVHAGGKGAVEVTDLQVSEAERGHGIGRLLVASAAKTGRQLGKSTMTLAAQDNGSGRLTRWYKVMGFAQTGVNRRGYAQLEAPIGRVLAGAAAQPNLPQRGPPPPLTEFGGPTLRPAAASRTAPPPNRPRSLPGTHAARAPFRPGIVQRMEGQLPPGPEDETPSPPSPNEERRTWDRPSRPEGIRPRDLAGMSRRLPFVMRLTLPGSGDIFWRTEKEKKKNTPLQDYDKTFKQKQKMDKLPPWQRAFRRLRKPHKNPISVNRIPVYTISGPKNLFGALDRGKNKIANNEKLATRLIDEFVKECQAEDALRPIVIQIKAHSRNTVTLSLLLEEVAGKYDDIALTIQVVGTDPVPGPDQPGRYRLDPGLKGDQSTIIYSIRSGHSDIFFTPQEIRGADRIIISRKDHEAGYTVGFRYHGEPYKGHKLNRLPPGVYVSYLDPQAIFDPEVIFGHKEKGRKTPETVRRCNDANDVEHFIRSLDLRHDAYGKKYKTVDQDVENRKDIIMSVVRCWFETHPGGLGAIRGGVEADDEHRRDDAGAGQ